MIKTIRNILFTVGGLILVVSTSAQNMKRVNVENQKYKLIWNDEFETEGVPSNENWDFESGFVRNNELQWYQADNTICENGKLVIKAEKILKPNPIYEAQSSDWRKSRKIIEYTSSCLITKNKQEWPPRGYYEISAKIDTSMGSWPAIWLLGNQGEWPDNGEIDIMEFYRENNTPTILANAAWGTSIRYTPKWDSEKISLDHFLAKDANWPEKFHKWSMIWTPEVMKIYLDDELLNTIDLTKTINADGYNPFTSNQEFYLLLNLAIGSNGGDPSNSNFPITYEVDYIRVYQLAD